MAPTVMVARVAQKVSEQAGDPRTAHISDLEFRGQLSPSDNTSQLLSQGIFARAGARDDGASDGRGTEKRVPVEALVEAT